MLWRYRVIFIFFILGFLAITAKLFWWQVIDASELAELGQEQYSKQLQITPQRGEIRTSDNFPLATDKLSYLVFANPKEISNNDDVANKLSPLLHIDSATISAQLIKNQDKFWIPIKTGVSDDTKNAIDTLKLPGVGFEEQYSRMYPEASMAAQLVGFVGKDEYGNDKGYFGLEGEYDRQLRGRPGQAIVINDAFGRPVLSKFNDNSGEQDGRTLVLHIDRAMQYLVDSKLKEGIAKYGAESGMAAVMDPKTGAIIAMSGYPNFDPNTFYNFDNTTYINPFITDTYEPGSTFKPLVMAAALNEHLITPTTTCPICSQPVSVGGYLIHTWDDKYFPNTNMINVMIHSDNTGMVYVAQKLGLDRMLSFLNAYGIGNMTGIDLQGELAPQLKEKDNWYPIDLATAGFGQGLAVTPIELLDAFAILANGGVRMQPQVVSQIITPDNQTIDIQPKVLDKPITPETAKVMTEILVHAVDEGEASFARLKGYRIAGKTGTASIPVNGHYDPTKTIASFIGFAPADNPKFIMLVILNKPTASIYGAETAAPIWFDIAKNMLQYYGIAPSGDE